MDYQLLSIIGERETWTSMETITKDDIKGIFKRLTTGKIKKVGVGKLHIENVYFPKFKGSGIEAYEGLYVFFATEKRRVPYFSIFDRSEYRTFVWPIGSNNVFALPEKSVRFKAPEKDIREMILLKEEGSEHPVREVEEYGRKHLCYLKKIQLWREFAIEKEKIVCTKDRVVQHFRWSAPDRWVRENFTISDDKPPMFFLRNEFEEPSSYGLRISYPRRPDLLGHDIDEN